MNAPFELPVPLARALRASAVTLMAACVALPLVQLLALMMPGVPTWWLVAVCAGAALEAQYSTELMRRRFVSGAAVWQFRAVEFALYFLVLLVGRVAFLGPPPELAQGWRGDPAMLVALLDAPTVLAWLLAVLFAVSVGGVAEDLERVGEPPERDPGYISPLDSLTGRFFGVGILVMVLSGLVRLGLEDVLATDRPPVTGLVLNVLIYFGLGLVLLAQVRLGLLQVGWRTQGLAAPPELPRRWLRYSLALVGLAALLAFALPTRGSTGLLGAVGNLLMLASAALWALIIMIVGLLLVPLGLLLRFGRPEAEPRPPPPPPPVLPQAEPFVMPPWAETLRPILLWALIAAMVLYVIISYVRERPELAQRLAALRPLRALRRAWAAFRRQAEAAAHAVQSRGPAAWLRARLARAAPAGRLALFRLRQATPAEQVRYYYLSLLRRAGHQGLGRRPPETPAEYAARLAEQLPPAQPPATDLTEAFTEARYSPRPTPPSRAQAARAAWHELRRVLRERGEGDE